MEMQDPDSFDAELAEFTVAELFQQVYDDLGVTGVAQTVR
jgi:hypothetical protein